MGRQAAVKAATQHPSVSPSLKALVSLAGPASVAGQLVLVRAAAHTSAPRAAVSSKCRAAAAGQLVLVRAAAHALTPRAAACLEWPAAAVRQLLLAVVGRGLRGKVSIGEAP